MIWMVVPNGNGDHVESENDIVLIPKQLDTACPCTSPDILVDFGYFGIH